MNKTLLLLLAGVGLYLYSRQQAQASISGGQYYAEQDSGIDYYANDTSPFVSSYSDGYTGILNTMIDTAENTIGAVTGLGTRGERNNNPGNIRLSTSVWQGQIAGSDSAFVTFASPEYGIRALAKLLNNYMAQGFNTVRRIINKYAPPSENVTSAYVSAVCRDMNVGPDTGLSADAIPALVAAIIHHENGRVIYTQAQMSQGVSMAFA